ncbi:P-loop containing nucleoside triphosphate hydrolase protein [Pelagophyceae sp. CCMP2097]|nr:P-loop containing nucleoside triphosphate hydrolase protein [Pelagophyceae sp. CCMP2097]
MWTAGRCALSLFAVALVAVHQGDSSQGVAARGAPLRFPAGLHRQPLAVRGGAAAKPKKKKAKKAPAEKDEAEADDVTYQLHKVKIAEDANLDASTVTVLASALAAMGLEDGDVVRVHGARRSATLAKVRAGEGPAAASSDVYGNAKRPSFVWLTKVANLSPASGVELALVTPRDSLPAGVDDAALLDGCVVPYFKNEDRPLVVGDVFSASYTAEDESIVADDLEIRWKVVALVLGSGASVEEAFCASESDIHLAAEEAFEDETTAPPRTYADLGGLQPQIELLKEVLELPLQQPYVFSAIGVPPPRGVLVTGPPGCGKSLLARAAAYESGAHVEFISGSEIVGKKAGEAEEALRAKFASAEANAPSIVVIDDLDAVGKKRAKASETEKRVCSQLLTLLDGLRPTSGVIVLGATSKPNDLDPALRRFGRLDREVEIVVPDASARLEILQVLTKSMRLAEDVALERIAGEAHGFVGADLAQLCTEAALATVRDGLAGAAVAVGADDGASYWENSNGDENLVFDALTAQLALEDAASPELSVLAVKQAHFLSALKSCNPSSLRESIVEVPDVSWADVGGLEDVKRDLKETVEYPIQFAHHYEAYGLPPSKGVLFYGPPGCGKTLIAKAVANECGANFISVKGPELLTMWFGESEANVRNLFDKARAAAPCILFFDEMDSIAKARSASASGSDAGDRVMNQILAEIDGVGTKNVFVIGATNRPDILDPAVTRPGRLDQLIHIPLPDLGSRLSVFKAALRKAPLDPTMSIDQLARATAGFSGADISEICQRACKNAVKAAVDAESAGNDALAAVPYILKVHFEESMSRARRSVPQAEIDRYTKFADALKTSAKADASSKFSFEKGGFQK